MIRILSILVCYLSYGNFNYLVNSLVIFSLLNIAFYSFIKEKKIDLFDFTIFIFSTYMIELFLGLPLFISVVVLSLPLLALSFIINNYYIHYSVISIFIFLLSLITFYFLNSEIFMIMKINDYLSYIIVFIILNISLKFDGKKQS